MRRLLVVVLLLAACGRETGPLAPRRGERGRGEELSLTTSAFSAGGRVPAQYTCRGANIAPPLTIAGVPSSAKSLALVLSDPDAPSGDFTHWVVWNIPPTATSVAGVEGTNGFGKVGYGGPCPPSGEHHYVFNLYALDTQLSLPPSSGRAELEKAMTGHVIGQTKLTGRFGS